MLIGPKYKICKRLGASVFEKCQTQKFQIAEARIPARRQARKGRRGSSDYGAQLLEKQKARFSYGLSESQFSRFVEEAIEQKGAAAAGLLSRLESRLDNVVYRAGFSPTRRAARQLVSHGHVHVGGRRVNIPSYRVRTGETISVRPESRSRALFTNRMEQAAEAKIPRWMRLLDGGFAVEITEEPGMEETEAPFNAPVVIQFYSR